MDNSENIFKSTKQYTSNGWILWHMNYSWPLNNISVNKGPLICRFFFSSGKYYSNTRSTTGWICRYGTVDMKDWLQIILRSLTAQSAQRVRSVPPTPELHIEDNISEVTKVATPDWKFALKEFLVKDTKVIFQINFKLYLAVQRDNKYFENILYTL